MCCPTNDLDAFLCIVVALDQPIIEDILRPNTNKNKDDDDKEDPHDALDFLLYKSTQLIIKLQTHHSASNG